MSNTKYAVQKTDQEWKQQLSAEEYAVLRKKGTERAFTGKYNSFYDAGVSMNRLKEQLSIFVIQLMA